MEGIHYHGDPFKAGEPMNPESGHAEFVLGLIRESAPGADITMYAALDKSALATAWHVATTMAEIAMSDEPYHIVNMSLGCYTVDNEPPLLLQRAIEVVSGRSLVVAAAGNHRQPHYPRPFWPAALDGVVSVGAVNHDGNPASFSPKAPWVSVQARGVNVVSHYLKGEVQLRPKTPQREAQIKRFPGYARWQGTSFAAATVTGVVAAAKNAGSTARATLDRVLADNEDPREPTAVTRLACESE
jgi:subtilisin family serine protease